MSGMWILAAALISFVVTALIGKYMIPFLKKLNFGQTIREEGPKWHKSKEGTPTMGGLMFIIGFYIAVGVCLGGYYLFADGASAGEPFNAKVRVLAGLGMALGFGIIGFLDDYIKVVKKRNLGLSAKQKLVLQFLVAGVYLLSVWLSGGDSVTAIPFVGHVDLGIAYWLISAVLIVGVVNAVNFTDGIDGLNGSVTFFVGILVMMTAGLIGMMGLSIVAVAMAGACMGFLVWNFNPAKVFMGDTGSLFLGGLVCALVYALDMPVLLFLYGIVYILEILSVVLQVTCFKLTHGKRIFKMSPIHHHFEMCGWSEMKICAVFSGVAALGGVAAMLLAIFG